tara:strand:- start:5532 stop:5780 length:249 start_codon:yes stop_codon:yes gene_type:complete
MSVIKKYTGLIGFLIALPLICIASYYKYYCRNEFEMLGSLGILLWFTTMALQYELNKEKPKNWFIFLVTGTFFVVIFLVLFN